MTTTTPGQTNGAAEPPKSPSAAPPDKEAIDELKRKLDELQGQLAELGKKPS